MEVSKENQVSNVCQNPADVEASKATTKADPMDTTETESKIAHDKESVEITPALRCKNLHLRKIIKENHGASLASADMNCFFPTDDRRHMVATAGANQINIYDNNHCGNHIDLACHFINLPTEYSRGGESSIVKFLLTKESENEALVAFGGERSEISVMSVAHTRIVRLLKGHSSEIIDIAPHQTKEGCFYSASRDNTIRFWNATDDNAQAVFEAGNGLECIAAHPKEDVVVAGYKDGSVKKFTLGSGNAVEVCKSTGFKWIDCIEFIDEARVLIHTVKGQLEVFNLSTGELTVKFKVPGAKANGRAPHRTKFGISDCRNFVCCGNEAGEVFIYTINSGQRLNMLSMPRIRGAVTKALFTKQCESVIVFTNDSILWRWDFKIVEKSSEA